MLEHKEFVENGNLGGQIVEEEFQEERIDALGRSNFALLSTVLARFRGLSIAALQPEVQIRRDCIASSLAVLAPASL